MNMKSWLTDFMVLVGEFLGFWALWGSAAPQAPSAGRGQLAISRAEYLDRARAIWTGKWSDRTNLN